MEGKVAQDTSDMKIAIVDDDPASVNLMKKKLESGGYANLISAATGDECLTLVRDNVPDLIVNLNVGVFLRKQVCKTGFNGKL